MNKSIKIKELKPKQHRVLLGFAGGLSLSQTARDNGYTIEGACRLLKTPQAVSELARLRAESEAILISELPGLVARSLKIISAQLDSQFGDRRTNAAMFVLSHLAKPLIKTMPFTASASDEVNIIEHAPPT